MPKETCVYGKRDLLIRLQAECFVEGDVAVQLSGPRELQTADDALAKAAAYLLVVATRVWL